MAKRGGTNHLKRIASVKSMPIFDKKENLWLVKASPGAHPKESSMPLGVLLRDVLRIVKTAKEAKKILSGRLVSVDGKIRSEFTFPVGFMDRIAIAKINKNYFLSIDKKARLFAKEISAEDSKHKILKVREKMSRKGNIILATHDGRNIKADNKIKRGDSIVVDVPKFNIREVLKLENNALCIITEGKHAGKIATIKELIKRKGAKKSEAILLTDNEEFITVADYIFVVNSSFKV